MKVIWLTGISGAGKSTIAKHLQNTFMSNHPFRAVIIDGDELRSGISRNVTLDDHGRLENVKNAAYMASLLVKQGFNVIVALMSPLEKHRLVAKEIIGPDKFYLVHVSVSIETVRKRDPKGLYEQFDKGLISGMYGCDVQYEVPKNCMTIDTSNCTPEAAAQNIYYSALVANVIKNNKTFRDPNNN